MVSSNQTDSQSSNRASNNAQRVGRALELLRQGLAPYVEREFTVVHRKRANEKARGYFNDPQLRTDQPVREWDAAALLRLMSIPPAWDDVFSRTLGQVERSYAFELREARNRWAHQKPFSSAYTERALDTTALLLTSISATAEAEAVRKMYEELRRTVIDQQTRNAKQRAGGSLISEAAAERLKPWREVATPHPDVRSGTFQQAEFAADLWQVHLGEGSDEYRDPVEFFRRTYLTQSLQKLLRDGIERLTRGGGDPVVQLQTNFGGGKTHSMLALYHLFSGRAGELPGVEPLFRDSVPSELPSVRRVVLVGNKISPGNPVTKSDGTVVRTLWGEIAWQLGGAEAYARIAADDKRASNPGDRLRELFNDYGPCLILIDEWVAYARQLHEKADLPGGDFETHFTFAQALTEAARSSERCLLLVSLPASDGSGAPQSRADDIEVGGFRGREALNRLRNVIGRVESSWRPATAEEGFEIVRRRLFEEISGPQSYQERDLTARAFAELYKANVNQGEFPRECAQADYERRIKTAYPIHPEVFDRLYEDWSTLISFQRTRGVLRLMAAVIHSLWEKGDTTKLILPSTIPIDDERVQSELTRYLSDNWRPIIEQDVDGPGALPREIDNEVPNLGKLSAARRAARTIYLGSAPTAGTNQRGLEDRRVKLGCVMPGESPQVFGDAVRRLASRATYLYSDGTRYWYSTQPTVTRMAQDLAFDYQRQSDAIHAELQRRLEGALGLKSKRENLRGDFHAIHLMPRNGADVADQQETRLVVLDPDYAFQKGEKNEAEVAAREILQSHGASPRLNLNTLAFLAADHSRLQDLNEAICRYLAWEKIFTEHEERNLDPHQTKQAKTQRDDANSVVDARLPEAYCRVLVPYKSDPRGKETHWQDAHLSSEHPLAERVSKYLDRNERLTTKLGAKTVRSNLEDVLWRKGDHVEVRTLVSDYAQQLYLLRLSSPAVLIEALRAGVANLTWEIDSFAYAESYDEDAERYVDLQAGVQLNLEINDPGLIVKADVAKRQIDRERATLEYTPDGAHAQGVEEDVVAEPEPAVKPLRRYHGSVRLDAQRVSSQASTISEEVIKHLAGLPDAEVTVTIEIEAKLPDGASEHVRRTVTENGRQLGFDTSGFEQD